MMHSEVIRGLAARLMVVLLASVAGQALASELGAPVKGQVYLIPSATFMGEDDDEEIDSHVQPGIGIGGNVTDRLAFELHFATGEGDFPGQPPDLRVSQSADVDSYRLDAVYDFGAIGDLRWRIHGVGGIGQVDYDTPLGSRNSDFFNVGMGLSTAITERLSIRGDVRVFALSGDSDEAIPATNVGLRYAFAGPVTNMTADEDGDGVVDRDDRCLGTAPGVDVDSTGCPRDGDRDGVPDASDACPRTPAGVSVDRRGCALDSDRDGVPDHLDACLDTPRGDEVDRRGCTVEEEMDVSARIELKLEFDYDSDKLRPDHYSEIERVAEFMDENPQTSAQLEGHTDSRGTEAYNQALSERRAYAVRDYLIDESDIDPRRITAVGYGESRPAATNDTDSGRQRNRRVEAIIETREMTVRPRRQN